ncbi:MAG TPA: response regulator, partial [Polyangiaceae bacterium]|jgi:DNA-binding response OmpR family regulator|nr:response regulator [Polyangiaceae bacterium]
VDVAYDGYAAVKAFESSRASVVFVDIGMPGMDGYELARLLRARFTEDPPMIVGLSGWGQAEDVRRGRDAGFDRHLVKPADLAALNAVLNVARERATVTAFA